MKVSCEVQHVEMDGDYGTVNGIAVTCSRCDHCVEVFGESGASVRRGLVMLRDECPKDESNFYVAEDE